MIIIAHRGLLEGPNSKIENSPAQIETAIDENFNVEVDVRYINDQWYLGHDYAQYPISLTWLLEISPFSWFHCKDINSLLFFNNLHNRVHYFWHEQDTVTLTNKNYIWAYPGKQPIKNSIAVMPELNNDVVDQCYGICTDYSYEYRKKYDS